jgi:hypothetical protein
MDSWALCFGGKLCVRRKSRSWFFGTTSTGSLWNFGYSVLAENLKLYVRRKNRNWSFGTNFPRVSLEKKPVGFSLFVRRPLDTPEKTG